MPRTSNILQTLCSGNLSNLLNLLLDFLSERRSLNLQTELRARSVAPVATGAAAE
jgi:hypothetical protein